MDPIKVVQVVDSLNPGGSERIAVLLANELDHNKFETILIATRLSGTLSSQLKADYHVLKSSKLGLTGRLINFRNMILKKKIQIVHAHGNSTAKFCKVALFGIPSIRIIHHDHNPMLDERNILQEKILLKGMDYWISVSSRIKDWVEKNVSVKSHLLQNPSLELNDLEIENMDSAEITISMLGTYRPQKTIKT